jgi:uncharacterized membrane-anchored protein
MIDARYWTAILAASGCGANRGDATGSRCWPPSRSERLPAIGSPRKPELGTGFGSIVLVAILLIVWFVSNQYGRMTKPSYWLTIVAARTAGTTLGDYLASRRGLNLGLVVSTICTSLLLAGIVILWRGRRAASLREA